MYVVAGIPAPQPTGRQGPRPASIPVLLNGAGASTPQRQESSPLSMRLGLWSGWENEKNCSWEERRRQTESQQDEDEDEEKEKERESADVPDPEKRHSIDRRSRDPPPLPHQAKPLPLLQPSHSSGRRRRPGQPH